MERGEKMEEEGIVSVVENRTLTADELGMLAGLIVDEPDHYTVLGVNRNASSEEIQAAYCLAVSHFHPLKSRELTESDSVMHWKLSSAFLRIEEAFKVLSRQSRRKVYDDNLSIRGYRNSQGPQKSRAVIPPPPKPKPVTHELRRVQRVPMTIPVRVSFEHQWQELTETLDVSPLGIRFRLSRSVEPGSEIRIELKMPRQLRMHSVDDEVYVVNAFVIYEANYDSGRQVVAEFIF